MERVSFAVLWMIVHLYLAHGEIVNIGILSSSISGSNTPVGTALEYVNNLPFMSSSNHEMKLITKQVTEGRLLPALGEVCQMVSDSRVVNVISTDVCGDCEDFADFASGVVSPVTNLDMYTGKSGAAFQLFPSPSDLGKLYQDTLKELKWTNFAVIYDTAAAHAVVEYLVNVQLLNKWNIQVYRVSDFNAEEILGAVKSREIHNVLVFTESDDKALDILTQKWIIGNLGLQLPLTITNKITSHGAYLVTFSMARATNLPPNSEDWTFKENLAYDAILATSFALKAYLDDGNSLPGNTAISPCQPIGQIVQDADLAEYMGKVNFDGLTGIVSFDDNKQRSGYTINVHIGQHVSTNAVTGAWSPKSGFKMQESSSPAYRYGTNDTLVITTITSLNFLEYNETSENGETLNGNDRFTGYIPDMVEMLSERMHLKYELRLVADDKYGTQDPVTGEWTGMIGELINQKADLAAAPLSVTAKRETVVDFTKPYWDGNINILVKKPAPRPSYNLFSFFKPLTASVWIMIIVALICVSLVVFGINRFDPYELRALADRGEVHGSDLEGNYFTRYLNCLWFLLSTFMLQSFDRSPRSMAARCMSTFWFAFVIITLITYLTSLGSFMTNAPGSVSNRPIKSLADLADQRDVVFGLVEGGSTMQFFKESKNALYQKVWQNIVDNTERGIKPMVNSVKDGIQRARDGGNYAFISESAVSDYVLSRPPCDMMSVRENIMSPSYALATGSGSPLREQINIAMMQMEMDGQFNELYDKYFSGPCTNKKGRRREKEGMDMDMAIGLENMGGIFLLLLIGIIVSIIIAVVEYFYAKKCRGRKGKYNAEEKEDAEENIRMNREKEGDANA
ncbi:glutamate receptor 4-like [Glandiceps talaboti]